MNKVKKKVLCLFGSKNENKKLKCINKKLCFLRTQSVNRFEILKLLKMGA